MGFDENGDIREYRWANLPSGSFVFNRVAAPEPVTPEVFETGGSMSTIVEQINVDWATDENRVNLGGNSLNDDVFFHNDGLSMSNGLFYPGYEEGTAPLSELPRGTTIGGMSVEEYTRRTVVSRDLATEPHRRDGFFFVVTNGKAVPEHVQTSDGDFEDLELYRCGHCGTVYGTRPTHGCKSCGWEVEDRLVAMIRKKVVGPSMSTAFASYNSGYLHSGGNGNLTWTAGSHTHQVNTTAYHGMLSIRADDGDVQIEPFTVHAADETMVTFTNTSQNFFVNRKYGQVVDVMINDGNSAGGRLEFRVNGRNTGVQLMKPALDSRVNNRMPVTIPIAAGAAIQMVSRSG